MKVTIANDTTHGGKSYKAGQTVEVDNVEARTLIHKGKAVEASPAAARKRAADPVATSAAAETTTPAKGKGKD